MTLQAQDVLSTFRNRIMVDAPTLRSRLGFDVDTTLVLVGVVWTFGGGKPRDPGFDYQGGGAPPH